MGQCLDLSEHRGGLPLCRRVWKSCRVACLYAEEYGNHVGQTEDGRSHYGDHNCPWHSPVSPLCLLRPLRWPAWIQHHEFEFESGSSFVRSSDSRGNDACGTIAWGFAWAFA
jgi:hypothetical protein